MRKKKIQTYTLENIEVLSAGSEGKCVSRVDGMVVFSEKTVPGDWVDLQVRKTHKSYAEGTLIQIHQVSPNRVPYFCEHAAVCGGCKWQQMNYSAQLHWKSTQVADALQRIGGITPSEVRPILGSERTIQYRNKTEFSFTSKAWVEKFDPNNPALMNLSALGFHIPGLYDKVFQVEQCHLMPETGNDIRNFIHEQARVLDMSYRDIRGAKGCLQTLMLRSNKAGEWMVVFMFAEDPGEQGFQLMHKVKEQFPPIKSVQFAHNPKRNDTWENLDIQVFSGESFLMETIGSKVFRIQPRSFFQTNPWQAENLYQIVRDLAGLTGKEVLYDLYAGTGTIGLFLSDACKFLVGIEYVADAVEDARVNAQLNQVEHCHFEAGDMSKIFQSDFWKKWGKPDIIITDPPRAGMHEDVISAIIASETPRVIYVSCNPSTLARDLQMMSNKYEVSVVCPVDMFPHTHHVECVVQLNRKG